MTQLKTKYVYSPDVMTINAAGGVEIRTPSSGVHTDVEKGLYKMWVRSNTPGSSVGTTFNVSSLTDDGTGLNDINFSNIFADGNYPITGTILGTTTTDNFSRYTLWSIEGNTTTFSRIETGYDTPAGTTAYDDNHSTILSVGDLA
jgi:hypothetical protein